MARKARQLSSTGTYHAIVRGTNRQDLFLEEGDRRYYLALLRGFKAETFCSILGYCLMDNHVHLLVKEQVAGQIGRLMHRLGTTYAIWFNQKYERVGHLFQGRYASEAIESDRSLMAVLRYIHQNPMKAGLPNDCAARRFSSHGAYLAGQDPFGVAETDMVTDMYGGNVHQLLNFFNAFEDGMPVAQRHGAKATDQQLLDTLRTFTGEQRFVGVAAMPRGERDLLLRRLKALGEFSLGQIARVTGVPKTTVSRA